MTKETMTIRQALAERKLLDAKIEKAIRTFDPVKVYATLDKYINGIPIDEYEKSLPEKAQSINALIKRREAINKAIFDSNAVAKITVAKFIEFESLNPEVKTKANTEEISIAIAINRKSYYKQMFTWLKALKQRIDLSVNTFTQATKQNREISQNILEQRFKDKQNVPKDWDTLLNNQIKLNEPVLSDPLNMKENVDKYIEAIEDYISTIDVKLSSATEVNKITINY